MRKRVYFISLFLLFFASCFVHATEKEYPLYKENNYASCPDSWEDITSIGNVKKNQILSSGDIISDVEAELFFEYHYGFALHVGTYDVNYYIVSEDDDGNLVYKLYEITDHRCTYANGWIDSGNGSSYLDRKEIYLESVASTEGKYQDYYLILPNVNGQKVKWRYVSEKEGTMSESSIEDVLKEKWPIRLDKYTKDYLEKLNEKDIYTIKIHSDLQYDGLNAPMDYNRSVVNFYEVVDEETNLAITCKNTSANKYNCSLALGYDYIASNIKIDLSEEKLKLNDFSLTNNWTAAEENNHKILEYSNDSKNYEFAATKEIATFTFEYSGDNPQEYIENSINAQVIELTNSLGTFTSDSIINNVQYEAKKNEFSITAIVNPNTTDKFIYLILIWIIILLSIIAIVINKKVIISNK